MITTRAASRISSVFDLVILVFFCACHVSAKADRHFLYLLTWPQQGHVPDRLRSNIFVLTRLSVSSGSYCGLKTSYSMLGQKHILG